MNDETRLHHSLTGHGDLPEKEWLYFRERLAQSRFSKGDFLVHAGDQPGDFHFITRGLVQLSYPGELGNKVIKSFTRDGEMTGPLLDWLSNKQSTVDIQALEHTETLSFASSLVPALIRRDAAWEKIVRGYVEALARKTEQRALDFIAYTPEKRYLHFMGQHADLCGRLTLNQIAAYLGITDVSLSRIRRRINNG